MDASGSTLPIYSIADQIVEDLVESGCVILSAPTGSGKSTQVPQILLDRMQVKGEIVILQPRRLAARLLAKRVSQERNSMLGGEVGYQVRFEKAVGSDTRLRFVTEAIFLRQVLNDPGLSGVGALIFDEFHERNLTADLSIACTLQSIRTRRPDLKIVVMSATLDVDVLQNYLNPCARIEASGRLYPVSIRYMGSALNRGALPVWERAAKAFRTLVQEKFRGNILIFMPGAYEIRKTITAIEALKESSDFDVFPLHGELTADDQDKALSTSDRSKIIVSTNVAETSITIDGVHAVIDGGLARVARFDPRRGINSILVESISRASAEQRAGRAGRVGPGMCLRLWSEAEHAARALQNTPEVRRVDLSESLLLLAAAGINEPKVFNWFESPETEKLERSHELLIQLGAIHADGRITERGQKMAKFPLHPRYSRMLIEADEYDVVSSVALVAGLSQGRSFYRVSRDAKVRQEQVRQIEDVADGRSDYFVHLRAWGLAQAHRFNPVACSELGIHAGAARQVGEVTRQLLQLARNQGLTVRSAVPVDEMERVCKCLLAGFSDHLAKRNDAGTRRCRMAHGRSGELRRDSVVEQALFVAAEIEERELHGEVTLLLGMATAVERKWLGELFCEDFSDYAVTSFDPQTRRVVCRRECRFRDLVLSSSEQGEPDFEQAAVLLTKEVLEGRLKLKNWNAAVESWIQRVNFVTQHCPEAEITPIDGTARQLLTEQICYGAVTYKAIKDRPVMETVQQWIRSEQHYFVDTYAPAEMQLPRRRNPVKVRYEPDGRALITSKLQDFYDVSGAQLVVANGKVPLLVELLAPNQRPVHITDDLDGFWDGAYLAIRKELAGRYPKHEWR